MLLFGSSTVVSKSGNKISSQSSLTPIYGDDINDDFNGIYNPDEFELYGCSDAPIRLSDGRVIPPFQGKCYNMFQFNSGKPIDNIPQLVKNCPAALLKKQGEYGRGLDEYQMKAAIYNTEVFSNQYITPNSKNIKNYVPHLPKVIEYFRCNINSDGMALTPDERYRCQDISIRENQYRKSNIQLLITSQSNASLLKFTKKMKEREYNLDMLKNASCLKKKGINNENNYKKNLIYSWTNVKKFIDTKIYRNYLATPEEPEPLITDYKKFYAPFLQSSKKLKALIHNESKLTINKFVEYINKLNSVSHKVASDISVSDAINYAKLSIENLKKNGKMCNIIKINSYLEVFNKFNDMENHSFGDWYDMCTYGKTNYYLPNLNMNHIDYSFLIEKSVNAYLYNNTCHVAQPQNDESRKYYSSYTNYLSSNPVGNKFKASKKYFELPRNPHEPIGCSYDKNACLNENDCKIYTNCEWNCINHNVIKFNNLSNTSNTDNVLVGGTSGAGGGPPSNISNNPNIVYSDTTTSFEIPNISTKTELRNYKSPSNISNNPNIVYSDTTTSFEIPNISSKTDRRNYKSPSNISNNPNIVYSDTTTSFEIPNISTKTDRRNYKSPSNISNNPNIVYSDTPVAEYQTKNSKNRNLYYKRISSDSYINSQKLINEQKLYKQNKKLRYNQRNSLRNSKKQNVINSELHIAYDNSYKKQIGKKEIENKLLLELNKYKINLNPMILV